MKPLTKRINLSVTVLLKERLCQLFYSPPSCACCKVMKRSVQTRGESFVCLDLTQNVNENWNSFSFAPGDANDANMQSSQHLREFKIMNSSNDVAWRRVVKACRR